MILDKVSIGTKRGILPHMQKICAKIKEHLIFLQQFVLHPTEVSAVMRTSEALSRLLVEKANITQAESIVELGPGTGAATTIINQQRRPSSKFMAIEINRNLIDQLSKKCPDTIIVHAPAEDLLMYLRQEHIPSVDAIVSGLPWSSFKISTQNRLLDVIEQALAPGGRFVSIAYPQGLLLPTGQAFRRAFRQRFMNVHASRIVWENIPPGFVYEAEKSRT